MVIPSFLTLNELSIVAFLAGLAYLVWRDRENIERHSIVFVRRTEHGIDLLNRIASFKPRFWKWWSTFGVAVGFVFMAWIFGLLLSQTLKLFLVADAAPPVGPVLPTKSTVTNPAQAGYLGLPFWHFLISLSVVLFAHEMMHGVIARVEGFDIESVGLILLGIIPGAFVQPEGQRDFFEPGEDQEKTRPWEEGHWLSRLRVLVGGPWANITIALLLGGVLYGAFTTAHGAPELRGFYDHDGMRIMDVRNGSPAQRAGLEQGMIITAFDGNKIRDIKDFNEHTKNLTVGEVIRVKTQGNGTIPVTLGKQPERGNYSFEPALIDHVLPLLEKRFPGAIQAYERYNNLILDPNPRLEQARWRWIAEHHPALRDRARERIQAIRTEDPESDGYMGILVVPEQHVNQGLKPYVGPIMLVAQLLFFIAILNFMIGAANLLPVKGLDGGWMVSVLMEEFAPSQERRVTMIVTVITLLMIVTSFAFLIARHL